MFLFVASQKFSRIFVVLTCVISEESSPLEHNVSLNLFPALDAGLVDLGDRHDERKQPCVERC
jgi:hypothetical protein